MKTQNAHTKGSKPAATSREDRLKAALKANLGRRKAQARARTDTGSDVADHATAKNDNNG